MRILISGATGFIGRPLMQLLQSQGHEVLRLARGGAPQDGPWWDPDQTVHAPRGLDGFDAVVLLCGEYIGGRRWTARQKRRLLDSRIATTELMARTLAALARPPQVFVSASAIGYYGNRGDEVLTEDSASGDYFISELCRQWEAACTPVQAAGIRLAQLRMGFVLNRQGGMFPQMARTFRLGLGGRLGTGRQVFGWIHLQDVVRAIAHVLLTPSLSGPINLTAPRWQTNADMARLLGQQLQRPARLALPLWLMQIILGPLARELLYASTRCSAAKLLDSGFQFRYPDLESALPELCSAQP